MPPISRRTALLVGISLLALGAASAGPARAQTQANANAANLLSPFEGLTSTPSVLQQNLAGTIAINNNATAAAKSQAISDNTITSRDASNLADGLGTALNSAYQANVPGLATSSAVIQALGQGYAVSGADSSFGKSYFGNNTTNGSTKVTGALANPNPDVYRQAYAPGSTVNTGGDPRPFQVSGSINQFAPASVYSGLANSPSFPSGHTTYGFTDSLLLAQMVPERFSQELTRGSEYGYSRVVLGVHYPLDVIAGRILATYDVAQLLNNNPAYVGRTVSGTAVTSDYAALFQNASSQLRSTLAAGCGGSVASCAAGGTTDRFSNASTNLANWEQRLNYGLASTGDTTLSPVVPTGAEVLLATRQPYLTAAQRRDVLASTEIASGGPLDNGSGWARLDLYRAGQGYGSLSGAVNVSMDASGGGLNAADTWSNDISGTGSLAKSGTGQLTLTGTNSFSGGTTVQGGRLVAASQTALGTGDVTVAGGTLVASTNATRVGGLFVMTDAGTLEFDIGDALGQVFTIDGSGLLAGGLTLNFLNGLAIGTSDLISITAGEGLLGDFSRLLIQGIGVAFTDQVTRTANGYQILVTAVPEPGSLVLVLAGLLGMGVVTIRRRRGAA